MNNQFESTYSLLVRSEEKGRGVLEIAVYAACILSVVFSICQFAQTPARGAADHHCAIHNASAWNEGVRSIPHD